MTLIGEQGFTGLPETDKSALREYVRRKEDELGDYMDMLVPEDSMFFSGEDNGDLVYIFSAAATYQAPDNPDSVVSAFVSRDVNNEMRLLTYSTPSTEAQEVADVHRALSLSPGVEVSVKRRYGEPGYRIEVGTPTRHASTFEQYEVMFASIRSTLELIEAENRKVYKTPYPGKAGRDGAPSLRTLDGYVLVPLGQPWQGRYNQGQYFLRSELSDDLLAALDARPDPERL